MTTTQNKPSEIRAQEEARVKECRLSGEQEEDRSRDAKNILLQLQSVLGEGEAQGTTAVVDDVLLKAEQFLLEQAQVSKIDDDTRRTLEDMAQLVGSTKQMARHKNLGDRLQKLAEETKQALSEARGPGISKATREATKEAVQMVETWRSLFNLLFYSGEFRTLIVDVIKIFREVFLYRVGDQVSVEKIVEGAPVPSAQTVKEEVQSNIKDEEWDRLYEDIAHVLVLISKQPSYREGIERMFTLIDVLRNQLISPQLPTVTPHAGRAKAEAEELIMAFTGRDTMNRFIDSTKKLIEKVDKDDRVKTYLKEIRDLIMDTKTGEQIHEKEFKHRTRDLASRGRSLAKELKYGDELNEFLDRGNELTENIMNDEYVRVIRHHAGLVANDISFVDTEGHVQVDTEMIGKLRNVIGPVLAESLKYIPIPRIESSNEYRDFWVDNIVLCGYDIVPDNIRIQIESDSEISIRDVSTTKSHTSLIVTLHNIRTELKNLDFYFKRKSFPEISDSGHVTLRIGGDGAVLTMIFRIDQGPNDKVPIFTNGEAHFDIHNLDIEFDKDSLKHDILVPMITNMFKQQIKHQIEKETENNFKDILNNIGGRLTDALTQVNRPFMSGFDSFRKMIKETDVAQVLERRREKLE